MANTIKISDCTHSDAGKTATQTNSAPGEVKSNNPLAAVGSAAAKVGKVAAGTVVNMALGSLDVGIAKLSGMKDNMMDRVSETTGGKIASAIKARDAASKQNAKPSTFDGNSLSAGTSKSADAASEVAAFRDRNPETP